MADILGKVQPVLTSYAITMLLVLFVFNAFYSAAFYRLRTIKNDKLCTWYPFISKEEKQFFKYTIWNYERTAKPLETISSDLRRLGIKRMKFF